MARAPPRRVGGHGRETDSGRQHDFDGLVLRQAKLPKLRTGTVRTRKMARRRTSTRRRRNPRYGARVAGHPAEP
jgi:hypothetical protein